jgi:hypothetical protein
MQMHISHRSHIRESRLLFFGRQEREDLLNGGPVAPDDWQAKAQAQDVKEADIAAPALAIVRNAFDKASAKWFKWGKSTEQIWETYSTTALDALAKQRVEEKMKMRANELRGRVSGAERLIRMNGMKFDRERMIITEKIALCDADINVLQGRIDLLTQRKSEISALITSIKSGGLLKSIGVKITSLFRSEEETEDPDLVKAKDVQQMLKNLKDKFQQELADRDNNPDDEKAAQRKRADAKVNALQNLLISHDPGLRVNIEEMI